MTAPKSFTSPSGRAFALGPAARWERYEGDPVWRITHPILHEGERAGALFQSTTYGRTAAGEGRWHASVTELRWRVVGLGDLPRGEGYDVAAFDSAGECLEAWARSADQILDHLADRS